MTIVAYCNQCGKRIPPDVNAGVRLVVGKTEVSFHLCEPHQRELLREVAERLEHDGWKGNTK